MKQNDAKQFEAAMAELEGILEQMGDETVGLSESIELYAKAAGLIDSCNRQLENARVRLEEIDTMLAEKGDSHAL